VRQRALLFSIVSIVGIVAMLVTAGGASAQDAEECLGCHSDPDVEGQIAGRTAAVHVDPEAFRRSVHADLGCVMCHQDVDPANLPHADTLAPVDCSTCHEQQVASHRASLHGRALARGDKMAPTCVDCHGKHDILPHADPNAPTATMNVPLLCGKCHREGSPVSRTHEIHEDDILSNYSESIHGEGLYRQGLTVTAVCTSCHTSHDILPHEDPKSSIHRDNITRTCTQCHARIEQVHRQVIEGELWEREPGKIPVCVDCHSPHKIRNVLYPAGAANRDCLRCHGDPQLAMQRDGRSVSLFVDEQKYLAGTHRNTACAQCHADVTPSRVRACETVKGPPDCSVCHAAQAEQYGISSHGTLHAAGDPDAPYCTDCHDQHYTQSKTVPASPTFASNVPVLCARCHRAGERAAVRIESEVPIVESYLDSIHGTGLLESGLVVTATCTNCHSSHGELPPQDPRSTVNSANVAGTCGKCHHGIEETFERSIHFTGNGTAEHELPTCEDCHSSHQIKRHDVPGFRTRMMQTCGRCHETQAETFFDTFHGKVSRLGSEGAAQCSDCHGTHDILPVSNPGSHLSRSHVVETCGKCHAGSHRRFAGYLTHATHHDQAKYPWLFWSFWFMTALLVGTLTFALLHTLAWLVRLWLTKDEWRRHKALAHDPNGGKRYRRFNRLQRGLHLVMLLSFFDLALTGMSLKFSYTGWAQLVSRVLGGFESMGFLHRLGGLTLFTVFGIHVWDVVRQKRRSQKSWLAVLTGPESILFTLTDVKQILQSVRWFFGLGPRPAYGRYTYWEKFDYFAVFWGVAVIGSTGLVLWFPEIFTWLIPGWSINVATIIHSDEALLAVGFIFTIHFFNTHFRPDKFPMDPVIFTGRVTVDELKYDKPDEYRELVASGRLEQHLVDPLPRPVERGFRVFGFVALGIGLTIIVLIVYAMLFGYR
jgi:predicted CXXCH cytochrome family protein